MTTSAKGVEAGNGNGEVFGERQVIQGYIIGILRLTILAGRIPLGGRGGIFAT